MVKKSISILILIFILNVLNQFCFAQEKKDIDSNQILNEIKSVNDQQQLLNNEIKDLRKDYENNYKILVRLTELNASSARYIIWFLSAVAVLIGIAGYFGINSMRGQAEDTIAKLKSDYDSLIQETRGSLGEIENSKKQIKDLKEYMTLASRLKEITPEKIDQQISSTVKEQVDAISKQLNELKVENVPKDGDIYSRFGDVYFRDQRYSVAIGAYKKAIEINPNIRDARFGLALTYAKLRDYRKDAIKEYKLLLDIYPDHITGIENLTELYLIEEDYESFDKLLEQTFASETLAKVLKKEEINILKFHNICSLFLRKHSRSEIDLHNFVEDIDLQKEPYISKTWVFDINVILKSKLDEKEYNKLIDIEKVLKSEMLILDFKKKYDMKIG